MGTLPPGATPRRAGVSAPSPRTAASPSRAPAARPPPFDATDLLRDAEALPAIGLEAFLPTASGGVLVLAPHPDDESLGCGGLLAALAEAGRPARVVVVSDGAASHPNSRTHPPDRLRALRREETVAALAALGLGPERLALLGLPDGGVPGAGPGFDAAVTAIANLARRDPSPPAAVLATWRHDTHPDHVAVAAMGRAVAAELDCRALFYPVWGLRFLHPTMGPAPAPAMRGPARGTRLDVTATLDRKRRAVAAHRSQTTPLIADDPEGFILVPAVLNVMLRPFELFLEDP